MGNVLQGMDSYFLYQTQNRTKHNKRTQEALFFATKINTFPILTHLKLN
jgi:hypothetical protein